MRETKSLYMVLHTVIDRALLDTQHMTGLSLIAERRKINRYNDKTLLRLLDQQLSLLRSHLANRNNPLAVPSSDTRDLALKYEFGKLPLDICICGNEGIEHLQTKIPSFLSPLWRRWLVGDCDETFAALYGMVSLVSKWSDPNTSNQELLPEYQAQQESMKPVGAISDVQEQLERLIPIDLDPSVLLPYYGPEGASYNHIRPIHRLGLYPKHLRSALTKSWPNALWTTAVDVASINRPAQVPKTWNKDRLIFVEEEARLNVQQAVRIWLEDTTPNEVRRFDFKNQDYQRASLSRNGVASIDLSAASDTIGADLVFKLLKNRPALRSFLFHTRARTSDGPRHRCYSTMGNATTFPIMTLFLAAVTMAVEKSFMDDVFDRRRTHFRLKKATVFGDDIVCDQHIMPRMLRRLRELGLSPNAKKTYSGNSFKESCGLDLYNGVDVTPIRVNNVLDLKINEQVTRLVDLSNRLHSRGLWHLASYVARLASTRRTIPVCGHTHQISGALWSFHNDHRDYTQLQPGFRWNSDYQCNFVAYAKSDRNQLEQMDSDVHLSYCLATGSRLVQVRDADEASRIARQSRDRSPRGELAGFGRIPVRKAET